jgi:hypothetical protein
MKDLHEEDIALLETNAQSVDIRAPVVVNLTITRLPALGRSVGYPSSTECHATAIGTITLRLMPVALTPKIQSSLYTFSAHTPANQTLVNFISPVTAWFCPNFGF